MSCSSSRRSHRGGVEYNQDPVFSCFYMSNINDLSLQWGPLRNNLRSNFAFKIAQKKTGDTVHQVEAETQHKNESHTTPHNSTRNASRSAQVHPFLMSWDWDQI